MFKVQLSDGTYANFDDNINQDDMMGILTNIEDQIKQDKLNANNNQPDSGIAKQEEPQAIGGTPDTQQGDFARGFKTDRKSTRLNSSHIPLSRMPSSA